MSSEQGTETLGETRTGSAEQLITETRAERDAARADPANWSRLDLNRSPDAGKYFPEPRPSTGGSPGEVAARDTRGEGGTAAPAGSGDRGRISVVFTDTDHGPPGPGELAWSEPAREPGAHQLGDRNAEYTPPGSQRPDTGELRIRDGGDIRDALLAGHSASDVRRAVRDQEPEPKAEPTTELVREDEQGTRHEVGTAYDQMASFGERIVSESKESRRDRERDTRVETTSGLAGPFKDWAKDVQKITLDNRSPGPTESRTLHPTAEYNRPQEQHPSAGDLVSLGIVSYVIADRAYGKLAGRYLEWYWRDRGRDDINDQGK